MSLYQMDSTKKLISAPTVVSSFVGIMLAMPLAFALRAPISASAVQPASQTATSQANVEDFAKFAHAFNQGYEASLASAVSASSDGVSCAVVEAPEAQTVAKKGSVSTQQSNSYVAPMVSGRGGGVASMKAADRMAAMVSSYYNYSSMVNNSSTVNTTNTNSHNTVGSNNTTTTKNKISVDDSMGVMIGVDNSSTAVQNNNSESFNKDSYNSTVDTDTSIINDSYNNETTTENTMNVELNHETTIGSNNTDNSTNTSDSNNTVNTTTNTDNSTTEVTDVDMDTDVDILSHNNLEVALPEGQV